MKRDRCVAVGVEVGAGKATVALIDRHGRVRQRCEAKTLRGRPALATLEPYVRAIDTMLSVAQADGAKVLGIGVSVPGAVDPRTLRLDQVPILPSLNSFPLGEFLAMRYHLPTQVYADVDAAVLGERYFGAGQGVQRLFFLTVNAIVGAALVVDGQLVPAERQYIGHACHLPISNAGTGPRCSCGKRGCINTLLSLDALQKTVQRALRRGEGTTLLERSLTRETFSLQLLAEEAQRGDAVALQVYNEVGRWLNAAIARYIDLFDPHMLILGGNVLRANEFVLAGLRTSLEANSSSRVCSMVRVVPALLGSDAPLIGTVTQLVSPVVRHGKR